MPMSLCGAIRGNKSVDCERSEWEKAEEIASRKGQILVKIRYNTENKTDLFWRIHFYNVEHLAKSFSINCPCWSTSDVLPDGRVKFHVTALANDIQIVNGIYTIN